MHFVSGLSISIISGLYTSLWGAFKDSPYEGLKKATFPRSIYFNIAIFLLLYLTPYWHQPLQQLNLFQIFFVIMGIERILSELYKAFFRTEDQSKYFIPSRITFFGKPVENDILRFGIGTVIVILLFFVISINAVVENFLGYAILAYITGLIVSIGGAYKDAPFEGFQAIKFQRSAIVLLFLSPLFYFLGPAPIGFILCMYGGMERFTVEYYKTYIQRNMSGKFKPDTQRIQKYLDNREKFHYLALIIISGVITLYIYEITTL